MFNEKGIYSERVTNILRVMMVLGGLFWLRQAVVLHASIPWWIGSVSLILALANLEMAFLCFYTIVSFFLLGLVLSELGVDQYYMDQAIKGMYYFLGFGLAFAAISDEARLVYLYVKGLLDKE